MTETKVPPPDSGATDPEPQPTQQPAKKEGWYRRFYNWVMHWAETPYAVPALFLISFAESSFFPIPPEVLLLPMCISRPDKAIFYGLLVGIASVLGGIFGYYLGYWFWEGGLKEFCFEYIPGFSQENFDYVKGKYGENAFKAVVVAGVTPIPYKVFTILSGVFHDVTPIVTFITASVVSRIPRFLLEALLIKYFGPPIREFIEKRLGLFMLLFAVLLICGFFAIKYLRH